MLDRRAASRGLPHICHWIGPAPVVGEIMNIRSRKRLVYRRHRIGMLIAAIEALMALEEATLEAKKAA
jgi:hypothetical protein